MPIRQHLTILGVLYLIGGAFFLIGALFSATVLTGIGAMSADAGGFLLMSGIGVFVAIFMGVLAAPSLLLGYGLLQRRSWARILGLIVGFLQLLNFPFGTLLGFYTIWILMKPEVEYELSGRAVAV